MTIQKAIQIYLDWKQTHTNLASSRYSVRLKHFFDFILPKSCLQDISGDDIIAFHKSMERNYSKTTIAYSARVLKNFFWFWYGRGETLINPKEIIPIKFINADKAIVTKSDFEDMNLVLDTYSFKDLEKKLILNLLWDTGMRVSELLEIKLSDISSQGINGLRTAKVRSRKTMRYNLVVWGSDSNELLNCYLGVRLCSTVSSDYLFLNPKSKKAYTVKSVQRWIKQVAELAILDKQITPHSFRHGKANEILEQGGTVRDVSALLRHSSPISSFNYLNLSESRYLQTAEKFLKTV
jgi:site-specific recombinase XerD